MSPRTPHTADAEIITASSRELLVVINAMGNRPVAGHLRKQFSRVADEISFTQPTHQIATRKVAADRCYAWWLRFSRFDQWEGGISDLSAF